MIYKSINVKEPLTSVELAELEAAEKKSAIYDDDDCPELTDEQLSVFAAIAKKRREERRKMLVSIRLSPETFEKAKKLGRGYNGILSRLLDMALSNPDMVKKCL